LFRVDFFDRSRKKSSLTFGSELRQIQIINKHYQVFAMDQKTYIYKNWAELYDCVKTSCGNERGVFACAAFKGDEQRFIIASLSDTSKCNVQVKDYVFGRELKVANIFKDDDDQSNSQYTVGDLAIDENGETLLIVNSDGTLLKTYSLYDLRITEESRPL
jgi:hypothetical protein